MGGGRRGDIGEKMGEREGVWASSEETKVTRRCGGEEEGGRRLAERKLGKEMLGNKGGREDGRQREKERLLCGQPVCEEVGRAPVASQ